MKHYNWLVAALVVLSGGSAYSDTLYLKSGDPIEGMVEKLEKDVLSIRLSDGQLKTFKRDQLSNILFGPPGADLSKDPNLLTTLSKPHGKFQTPADTFRNWRAAAVAGNINGMVECYASFRQEEVRKQLKGLSKNDLSKMREATAATNFIPSQPLYQGDRAMLDVNWQKGLDGDSQSLQFILEKNDWKLIQ